LSQTDETALSKVGGENTYTKKNHVHALSAAHIRALFCVRMSLTYSSGKRLLSSSTDFNSRDVQRLYKIRFINYGNNYRKQERKKDGSKTPLDIILKIE